MINRLMAVALTSVLAFASSVSAAPIVPAFTSFGPLPAATFGGSGIPNDRVAVTTVGLTSGTLTLGLTATERYDNPEVTDNAAGVYFAVPGPDTNTVSPNPAYAKWNFNFFVQNTSTAEVLTYGLYYDFDPATGNDQSTHGFMNLSSNLFNSAAGMQNSFNLGMLFLNSDVPGIITSPTYSAFNPNQTGERSFALVALNGQMQEVGRVAIVVDDGEASVPEPTSLVLLGLGLIGAARMRRRK